MGSNETKRAPPPPPSLLLDNPWRVIDWKAKEDLLKYVRSFKPKGASHVRILVYGPVGAGKSSFINSAGALIVGRKVNVAAASASNATTSFTVEFKTHQFEDSEEQTVPIVFNDLTGLEAGEHRGVQTEDIKLAMKGHVKERYPFNPSHSMSQDNAYFNPNPTIDDKVHVLVCMLDANAVDIHPSVGDKIKEIHSMARDLGIPQVAVVTHIDKICGETEKKIQNVYRSKVLKTKMDQFSKASGIPIDDIYAVRNSYEGLDRNDADTLILTALKDMVNFGKDSLDANMRREQH